MKTLAPLKVADHLYNFVKDKKDDGSFISQNAVVRDALQKEYERCERLKKRAK